MSPCLVWPSPPYHKTQEGCPQGQPTLNPHWGSPNIGNHLLHLSVFGVSACPLDFLVYELVSLLLLQAISALCMCVSVVALALVALMTTLLPLYFSSVIHTSPELHRIGAQLRDT